MKTARQWGLLLAVFIVAVLFHGRTAIGNIPGGGTGTGANVTVTTGTNGTVTMSNGICSITLTENNAHVTSVIYTTGTNNVQMLDASNQWYYGGFMLGSGSFSYTLAVDPATTGGNYADLQEISTSATSGVMTSDWIMTRGSPGFYTSAAMSHRAQDGPFGFGAWGIITRVPPQFNWLSQDSARNFYIGVQPSGSAGSVPNSPHEISVNGSGSSQGQFADKFIWGEDHKDLGAWGWSSVGAGNLNVGNWLITNMQYSDGGPLKRDVFAYSYNNQNNSILTNEVGMGSDGTLAAGEIWNKTAGPWFMYFNSTNVTGTSQAAQALFNDAQAQAAAEQAGWPYPWFTTENYVPASGRGTVTGTIKINSAVNPAPTLLGTTVGLVQQPITSTGAYDFQRWLKPYQYFTTTDANGNFTIPAVIAGGNYTLWVYGPGAAGTFISQNQTGGNPPILYNLPATPFSVTVTANATTNLGTETWTPTNVGSTVFELGVPDRKADEFRHGEDFWTPEASPQLGYPTSVWGAQMLYPIEYPNGVTYTVGQSRWSKDWNYVLPSIPNNQGVYQTATGTINFNLATSPANGALASVYIGIAQTDTYDLIVSVNGVNLGAASGVTATPNALTSSGFNPPYSDDSSIHFSDHGPFSDERITFPANLLRAGSNSISIEQTYENLVGSLMLDYLRLELTGYVPPAPASVTAYPGNSCDLVCWPVVPGATQYNVLRSTTSGGGYSTIATGIPGAVCGSDTSQVTYTDTNAIEGTEYYYAVQSANTTGTSANSAPSAGAIPSASISASAPAAPGGLSVAGSASHMVALSWNPSSGADYYSLSRTTLYPDGIGDYYPLRTIVLNDALTATSSTDTTVTDGRVYSYSVQAIGAGGISGSSAAVTCMTLPAPPMLAPGLLACTRAVSGTSATLSWSPVPGAEGYDVYRSTSPSGPFTWPADFIATTDETTFRDTSTMSSGSNYIYQVTAVNVGGISPSSTVTSPAQGPAVTSGTVTATNGFPFSYTIVATESPASYQVSGLPNGVTANLSTGVLSGTPTVTGTFTSNITAINGTGIGNGTLTIIVANPSLPVISSAATATGTADYSFSYTIAGSNLPTYSATGLPAGLAVNAASGVISGIPTVAGTFSVVMQATNAGGTGTKTLTLTLRDKTPPVINVPQNIIVVATSGTEVTFTTSAIDAVSGPCATTNVPASGSVFPLGTTTVNVTATDPSGNTAQASFTVTVSSTTPVPLTPATVTATAWDGQIDLNWQPSALATGYIVQSATSAAGPYTVVGNNISAPYFSATGLSDGTPCYYTVSAVGSSGTSASSNAVSATPVPEAGFNAWTSQDIGSVAFPGRAAYASGTYSMVSSGADIWNTADAFHFLSQPLTGNGTIVAKVLSVQNVDSWVKSGLMFRNSLAADDANVFILITPGNGENTQWRTAANDSTSQTNIAGPAAPYWVMAVLSGSTVATYMSPDGVGWVQPAISQAMVTTGSTIYTGLALTAHDNSVICSSTFASVNILPGPTWLAGDIGSPAIAGFTNYSNGQLSVQASGTGMGGSSDQGRYVYRHADGNSGMAVEVMAVENTSTNAQAGIMLRDTTAANSDNVAVFQTPHDGIIFQQRASVGGTTTELGQITGPNPPYWLMLSRSGNVVTAYAAPDGFAWSALGSATVTMGTNAYIGVAASSDNPAALGDATVANMIINTSDPAPPVITSPATVYGTKGVPFSYTIAASNGAANFYTAGLPSGFTYNGTTAVISGTPTSVGTYTMYLTAINDGGLGSLASNLVVNPPAPVITNSATVTGTATIAFNYDIPTTNSPTLYIATGLPAGLAVAPATGVISGTPTAIGLSTVNLTALNAGGSGTSSMIMKMLGTSPPVISATNITVEETSGSGAAVTFTTTAVDSLGDPLTTINTPPPGSFFLTGTTGVTVSTQDAAGTGASATFTVTVVSPMDWWRVQYFGSPSNAGDAADLADPEGDGVSNLLAYAMGLSPFQAKPPGALPSVSINNGKLQISFPWQKSATDITYNVQASGDLSTWSPLWTSGTASFVGPGPSAIMTIPDTVTLSGTNSRFMRLQVTRP